MKVICKRAETCKIEGLTSEDCYHIVPHEAMMFYVENKLCTNDFFCNELGEDVSCKKTEQPDWDE